MTEKLNPGNIHIEPERLFFKELLAQNPNYFGNLVNSTFKPVKTILGNTTYEEISCVGFNPNNDLLEATIRIKLPSGYGTDLCHAGTYEYVRFYLDYGSGWEDVGVAGFNIHDIPNGKDCAGSADKPLMYVVSRALDPTRNFCGRPVLPRVRAILSWNHIPPAATPNWAPIWGNVVDRHIQIRPRLFLFKDVFTVLNENAPAKLKIPPFFQAAETLPIPIPDPPPLSAIELAALYGQAKSPATAEASFKATAEAITVPPHRFALEEIHPALTATAFSQAALTSKITEFSAAGLDWAAILAELLKTSGNTQFEQLNCLGLDYQREWLVATFTIKRPTGYSGTLCQRGSTEYVAFWADWDNECKWQYMGTVPVQVHDISGIPADGLQYAAILPVDLTRYHRGCSQPRISRIRAVLSWNAPPSTNPEIMPYWGNRLDAHVQIQPGRGVDVLGEIRAIGGIPVEDIDAAASGYTLPAAVFWYDGVPADDTGLQRPCPFGGQILVHGQFFPGHKYRVKVRKATDVSGTFQVVTTPFTVLRWTTGFTTQTADADGFFTYLDPTLYMDRKLAVWNAAGDDLWELQLEVADMASNIQGSTPWYRIQLDNTAPVAMITPDAGECRKYLTGTTITGHFTATDANFGKYVLSTQPNTATTPSNQPVATTGQPNTTPTSPGHDTWQLSTVPDLNIPNTILMKACGYVVRVDVSDRTILDSLPGIHNTNAWETGFCLVDKL